MENPRAQKGQLFSLDFLIAMGIAVLAIGLLLNHYSISATAAREARIQNELNSVALVASTLMLEKNRCSTDFGNGINGYKVYGCSDPGPLQINFKTIDKSVLMIPSGFDCNISWSDLSSATIWYQDQVGQQRCTQTPPKSADIAAIDRNFMVPKTLITKKGYEQCIYNGTGCSTFFQEYTLKVMVWKTPT